MKLVVKHAVLGIALCGFAWGDFAGRALAQDASHELPTSNRQFDIEVGVGGSLQSRYPGSDEYLFSPFPIISVGRFYVPGLGQVVDGRRKDGVFFFPSFDFHGERTASDDKDLAGTRDVDWAVEVGLGAGYRTQHWRAFVEIRQGFNGHTGQVGQLGADAILYPTEKLEFNIGPRLGFGFGDYMDTYYGVTAAESAASGGRLRQYDPDSGFTSVGLAARASYNLNEKTRLHLAAGYDRLIGDAADRPIADVGSKDQFRISTGISYRFSFDIFD